MGKGIGPIKGHVIDVKAGQIILEFTFQNDKIVKDFLAAIKSKIPAKTILVIREL
jgi:ribosomal protein L16/L10AE